jgi:hypothetical protein
MRQMWNLPLVTRDLPLVTRDFNRKPGMIWAEQDATATSERKSNLAVACDHCIVTFQHHCNNDEIDLFHDLLHDLFHDQFHDLFHDHCIVTFQHHCNNDEIDHVMIA